MKEVVSPRIVERFQDVEQDPEVMVLFASHDINRAINAVVCRFAYCRAEILSQVDTRAVGSQEPTFLLLPVRVEAVGFDREREDYRPIGEFSEDTFPESLMHDIFAEKIEVGLVIFSLETEAIAGIRS